ncbi:MAG: glycosyltransferase family 2 protein [Anaerolineae bacterium]|nr:glycosyltransferase family 2 protein [Anaerolineae bacterium]
MSHTPKASPRVTVVTPSYNSARYIAQTVNSVLAQTFTDFEHIIVDDGSTDNTRELLEPYLQREPQRLIYVHQQNAGESVARNNAIRRARGEYVAFLDSDDWWTPNNLALQVPALDAAPEAVASYAYSFAVDNDGNPISFRGANRMSWGQPGVHALFERLVMGNVIANPNTVLARKTALLQTTLFDEDIEWGEDWQLWLQLSLLGPFLFTPQETACYRMRRPGRRLEIEASDDFVSENATVLQRAFDAVKAHHLNRADWLKLEPTAFRELYLRSAIHNFELGDMKRAANYLEKMAAADPAYLRDQSDAFVKIIADIGFRLGSETGDFAKGLDYVRRVFDHLPQSLAAAQPLRGQALAELHMAAAFTEHEQGSQTGSRQQIAQHAISAMRAHWPNVRNRGLWAIGLKSVLGLK